MTNDILVNIKSERVP